MDYVISPFLVPITAIIGAFVYVIIKTMVQSRVRELEIRERIALIERGLVPPPEVDPRGFDRAMLLLAQRERRRGSGRHRRAGVTLMGVGFGLMVLIAFAGESPRSAVGVGGFLVIIGLAFFINSLIENHADHAVSGPQSWGTPSGPPPAPEPSRHE